MKFWGWVFRIAVIALGVGLFLLQSQVAKKAILEFIVNQPFKNSPLTVEAQGIRGLFPFQFTVSSLSLKKGDKHLATLSDIFAAWSLPALMNQQVKVHVEKKKELAGTIIYILGKHALFSSFEGQGLRLGNKGLAIQSVMTDLPALNLLKGQVIVKIHDGQELASLTLQLEELDEERLKIQEIILAGKELTGKGAGTVYPKQGAWEGKADITAPSLGAYGRWFPKELAGFATLQCQKALNGPTNLDLRLSQFQYGDFEAKALDAQAIILDEDEATLTVQGQEALVNNIPLLKLSAVGNFAHKKGSFDITGIGRQNISFHTQGSFTLPMPHAPQTQVTIAQAALRHPTHQFSLKYPVSFAWTEKHIRAPKLWLETAGGMITIQDLVIDDALSGTLSIERFPLTLFRVINPKWVVSGSLSGKGKLKGTIANPEVELSLEGKSLRWEKPTKPHKLVPRRFLGIDLSTTLILSQGFLSWQAKLGDTRLFSLTSQGKLSIEKWRPMPNSSLEATLKGQGDLSILSLFMGYGDLIQGHVSIDLMGTGTVKSPLVKGHVSVTNGLYENATFGTLIKNITVQGRASGDVLTLSSITGKDNAKGSVKGHGSLQFISFFNPNIDLHLLLDQLIVAQNDEIFARAKGVLKLQGPLRGDSQTKAKITGDIIVHPLELRLNEHAEKIVTIKLIEKKTNQPYQISGQPLKQSHLQKDTLLFPLDIKMSSPGEIYIWGYGFDAQWKGTMNAVGTITDPQLVGEITLTQGKYSLLGKPLKLTEGRITYFQSHKNNPALSIVGARDMGEVTAIMRIEGYASDPKITFSSNPALPQEEVLARLLFGKGIEGISVTQSLLLANALSTLKGRNHLNFTDKIRSAFGLDVLEFKERKSLDKDDFKSPTQQVSVGKQILDKVYFSVDQSVNGDGGTNATVQFDVTPSLKIEADIGGSKNTGVGFTWVKKY